MSCTPRRAMSSAAALPLLKVPRAAVAVEAVAGEAELAGIQLDSDRSTCSSRGSVSGSESANSISSCVNGSLHLIEQWPIHDATGAFLCMRMLGPKVWWRARGLSRMWKGLIDGDGPRAAEGLFPTLLDATGPLRTANEELDFAGCVYTAVHFGNVPAVRCLLRPLSLPTGWARRNFALGVAREALLQGALAWDDGVVEAVLASHGPGSMASACRQGLVKDDAVKALEAMRDWESAMVDDAAPERRDAVRRALLAVA